MNNPTKRDEFSNSTKMCLAGRAGNKCSKCGIQTLGPSETDGKVSIGQACHITAARENGPRYNPSLSAEERKSYDNGIHLCGACALEIDKNKGKDFSVSTLLALKKQREDSAKKELGKPPFYFHSNREWNYTEFEPQKNITGDRTFFSVPFSGDPYITLKSEGTFEIRWKILLENITSQKTAIVKLITTNKIVSFDYDLLILKDSLTQVQLNDEIEIECDLLDTVKLEISVGSKLDPKSVHLISSPRCYFIGNLSHSIKSKY